MSTGSSGMPVLSDGAVERVPVGAILTADSPRLNGEDIDHIRVLAGVGVPLPPIVVHRQSMRVLDGMHRLRAAILRGDDDIDVHFFDGDEDEGFIIAVQANIAHGLPLTLADRRAAALRILRAYPTLSDRAVAAMVGLSHKTVGSLRRSPSGEVPQSDVRVGRDGRERPTSSSEVRRKARMLLLENPDLSLREVARVVGISPETARDVRRRMGGRGDAGPMASRTPDPAAPVDALVRGLERLEADFGGAETAAAGTADLVELLHRLNQDPTLRLNQVGRHLLRLLAAHARDAEQWRDLAEHVPAHRQEQVARAARICALGWSVLAGHLETSARTRDT
jgi:ParB-like chromosome segregation protein Spo0J